MCVLAGGTIGHYLCNMWVVDDRGGNVSFIKPFGRMIIKSLLGWYSFLAMVMTSRHQAVHDLLTRSTVQMRDLTKSKPYHFRPRRDPPTPQVMPSPVRRAAAIAAYLLAGFILYSIFLATLALAGPLSRRCIDGQTCTASELAILILLWAIWGSVSVRPYGHGGADSGVHVPKPNSALACPLHGPLAIA